MTNGTLNFLKSLNKKHPNIHFYFMNNGTSTVVYYEGNHKNVFSSGRTYNVLTSKGDIQDKGFIVMNNIPVAEEEHPVFEDRFKNRQNGVETMPGFQAFRLLSPAKGNTYIVLTQWASEQDFENWKKSDQFAKAHQEKTTKPPAYFLERPFITSYQMIDPDQ